MLIRSWICGAFAVVIALAHCLPAHADNGKGSSREAGPEDGILCCNGVIPFLFRSDDVLTTTGRAGIFRSGHRGERWQHSMKGLVAQNGVSPFANSVCQAPSQPRTVYAIAGTGGDLSPFNGLFSSDDFGATWNRRASVATGFGFASCAVDAADPRTVYVSTADADFVGQLWKSTDGGRTVQIIGADIPAYFGIAVVRTVRGTVYVGGDLVYASTDRGVSFHLFPFPPGPGAAFYSFDASPDGRAVFLTTFDGSFNPIGTFRSTDGGASYLAVSGLPFGFGPLAFDPTNPSRIYASDGLLNVSHDGGLNFALLPASDDPRFLGPFPVHEIGVDPRGSVYVSTMGGRSEPMTAARPSVRCRTSSAPPRCRISPSTPMASCWSASCTRS
jgi:hypothetical protein